MRTRQSHPIRARDSTFMLKPKNGTKNVTKNNLVHIVKVHPKTNAIQKETKNDIPIPRNYITFSKKMTDLFKKKYPSLSHVAIMSKVYQSWKSLRAKGDTSTNNVQPKVEKQETTHKNASANPPRITYDDRAQAQIEYFQNVNKGPIVSKYTVRRMIAPYLVVSDPSVTPFRVKEEALQTILTGMERYLVNTFSKASKLTGHRSRKSLTDNDISMLMDLVAPPKKELDDQDDSESEYEYESASEASGASDDSSF